MDLLTTYDNCTDAYRDGRSNIPVGDPSYQAKLDRDGDKVACDQPPAWFTPRTQPTPSRSTSPCDVKLKEAPAAFVVIPQTNPHPIPTCSPTPTPTATVTATPTKTVTTSASAVVPVKQPELPLTGTGTQYAVGGGLLLVVGALAVAAVVRRKKPKFVAE